MNKAVVGLIVVGALLAAWPAVAVSQATAAKCELHVWGAGFPNRKMPKRLEEHLRKTNPPETFNVDNPVSNANVFNTANRAKALPDASLRALMNSSSEVMVIRHDTMIDQQISPLKNTKGRLYSSPRECYADVVVADNYAIYPSTRTPQDSVLKEATAAVIVGGDRFVTSFWMQRFESQNAKGRIFSKKFDSPVAYAQPNTLQNAEAVGKASEKNLDQFVAFVSGKTK